MTECIPIHSIQPSFTFEGWIQPIVKYVDFRLFR
jgi:hypothetical protein